MAYDANMMFRKVSEVWSYLSFDPQKKVIFLAHFHVLVSKQSLMTSEVRYLVSINICWFITYCQNPLPSITFWRFSFKMASDTNVMFSKSFWRTEWSFHWSQWKSYYFGQFSCFGLKTASNDVVGSDINWMLHSGSRNIFCFITYPQNLLPSVTFWRL